MKMEVQVKALVDGVVQAVHVQPGGKVVEGALLMTLKAC
jgi:biotin carboxyl carrier protein